MKIRVVYIVVMTMITGLMMPGNPDAQCIGNSSAKTQRHPAEPEMVEVEGGTFTMGCTAEQGSDCYDNLKTAHSVTVRSFQIGKFPVRRGT
jgi:formylglycine-generating enzyme required for sulfatase activity